MTPIENHTELCKKYDVDLRGARLGRLENAIEAFIASKVRERDLADDEILRAREDLRSLSHPSLIEAE